MDLWSNDPAERLAAAVDPVVVGHWPRRIGDTAPVRPWPFGMPSSINPFVVFLGASPGGSPPACEVREPYELPTAGVAHPKLYVCDGHIIGIACEHWVLWSSRRTRRKSQTRMLMRLSGN